MSGHTPNHLAVIQQLFDASAESTIRVAEPLLAALTADFVANLPTDPTTRTLDAGTGTGLSARLLAPYVRHVTGVDVSPRSLRLARQNTPANVSYVQADLAQLPCPPGAFALVIASFTLHMTDPWLTLRALRRVLAPGGWLAIQEWGPLDPLQGAILDSLADFATVDPPPALARLRASVNFNIPLWGDVLQDPDDYREVLTEAGFSVETADEIAPVAVRLESPDALLRFVLTRTIYRAEFDALDESDRAACVTAVHERLRAFAAPDGALIWQPVVLRVTARVMPAQSRT